MTDGISKERLEELLTEGRPSFTKTLLWLIRNECKELDPWLPIDENTPKDQYILVYAPPYQDLRELKQVCKWHESAGFCIDELRTPTHYKLLTPMPPTEQPDTSPNPIGNPQTKESGNDRD